MTSPDVEERLESLIDAYEEAFEHDEPRICMVLGVYQDTWLRAHRGGSATSPRLRQGRRTRWLDTVLQPLALSEDRRQRLKTSRSPSAPRSTTPFSVSRAIGGC